MNHTSELTLSSSDRPAIGAMQCADFASNQPPRIAISYEIPKLVIFLQAPPREQLLSKAITRAMESVTHYKFPNQLYIELYFFQAFKHASHRWLHCQYRILASWFKP
jgi:hypothetical protein